MTSAETYLALTVAVDAQRARLYGQELPLDRWGEAALIFRFSPLRELDANLSVIASYVLPTDTFIDVGGGAGRVSLAMALRCHEVVNIDPSPGMGSHFEDQQLRQT